VSKRGHTPPHNYTAAEIRFLERKVAGRSYAELTELFNRRFGLSFTVRRLSATLGRLGVSNGRDCRFQPGHVPSNKGLKGVHHSRETEFKLGNRPHNWLPPGSERISPQGYAEIKVRNPNKWKAKHRVIWEKAHGKIPRGRAVIFADGNKANIRLDNLIMVSRDELAVMNHLGLISSSAELTQAGKTMADIKIKIAALRRGAKKKRKPGRGKGRRSVEDDK
jgi:hypothetical protein